jgi:hypothetical protein
MMSVNHVATTEICKSVLKFRTGHRLGFLSFMRLTINKKSNLNVELRLVYQLHRKLYSNNCRLVAQQNVARSCLTNSIGML